MSPSESGAPLRVPLALAAIGATLGTVLDWTHVATGAIAYPRPVLSGLAWWVPLIYASAGLGMTSLRTTQVVVELTRS